MEAVRFYEKQGLIKPAKRTSGNFRVYTEEHLKQLSFICYCRSLDISLKEIKMLLNPQCATQEQEREINELWIDIFEKYQNGSMNWLTYEFA